MSWSTRFHMHSRQIWVGTLYVQKLFVKQNTNKWRLPVAIHNVLIEMEMGKIRKQLLTGLYEFNLRIWINHASKSILIVLMCTTALHNSDKSQTGYTCSGNDAH